MIQQLFIILAIASTVLAGDCKKPKPVDNFSLEKYSGDWFIAALDSLNATEAEKYKYGTCGVHHFLLDKGESKSNEWFAEYVVTGNKADDVKVYFDLNGTYFAPNPKTGFFEYTYPARELDYDYTVMGTDYTTWAATYCCSQIAPGKTSEFVFVLLRNLDKYEETVHKEEVKKCYTDVIKKPVDKMHRVRHDNCPDKTHGAQKV